MLAVTGYNTTIVQSLLSLIPTRETVRRIAPGETLGDAVKAERFVFAAGLLLGKAVSEYQDGDMEAVMQANYYWPVRLCEQILAENPAARIVVLGSESGIKGSHDTVYAGAKAALHKYVETKKLKPYQQLVCVAPSIVEDSGMTQRRQDLDNLERRRREHPKGRLLKAKEVARLIHFLLYVDRGYISGTTIVMNGGA